MDLKTLVNIVNENTYLTAISAQLGKYKLPKMMEKFLILCFHYLDIMKKSHWNPLNGVTHFIFDGVNNGKTCY